MACIVCFGEILVRLSAPAGELLLQSPELRVHIGGAEANVAISLARFGHTARMASCVADNALGDAALGELRRHGVDTSSVTRAAGRMGLYFLTPGAGQRPSDIIYDRARSAFATAAITEMNWRGMLDGAAWLHVSGVTPALSASCAEAALNAMKLARAAGVKVSYDANFRAKLWEARAEDPRPTLDAMFAQADLIFADARDVALVTGQRIASIEQAAEIVFARYANAERIACTTRKVLSADHHELSAATIARGGGARSPVRAVTGIVDRIGGGDAFAAGLLHGLTKGAGEQDMIDFALAAACLKHAIPGDANLASEADVRFYLENASSDVRR